MLFNFLIQFYMFCCILSQLLCSVKKLKQEVLLDPCCLHLAKWSNLAPVRPSLFDNFQLLHI